MNDKQLKIINRQIDELIPYLNNPRNNEKSVDKVANSIREFGFKVPIVIDKSNMIVCGHTRWKAAKKLGMDSVPCIVADDLSDGQLKAYRLADNKVGESSEWVEELLLGELQMLGDFDMEAFGFSADGLGEDLKEEEEKLEVEFTEVLEEENNYIVLKFSTDVDWLQALSVFGLKQAAAYSTRKDGKVDKNRKKVGVGRVIDGAAALQRLLGQA